MESLEVKFQKVMTEMTEAQGSQFFSELTKRKRVLGNALPIESQLNLAESIVKGELIAESAPVRRNNGAVVQESQMTDIQERQAKAWQKMGFSEVEAKIMSGCYDADLKKALVQGKTASQFFESIRESATPEKSDLKGRQSRALNLLGK